MKIIMLLVMLSFLVLPQVCNAMEPHSGGVVLFPTHGQSFYLDESGFVEVPAKIGMFIVGFPGTFIFLPPALLIGAITRHSFMLSWLMSTKASVATFGAIGYFSLGSPFYIVKKTFWDAPIFLWNSIFEEENETSNKIASE